MAGDVQRTFRDKIGEALSVALRTLLETKHLYQRVVVDPDPILASMKPQVFTLTWFDGWARQQTRAPNLVFWGSVQHQAGLGDPVPLRVGNVKTWCAKCGARETHAPIMQHELVGDMRATSTASALANWPGDNAFHLFSLAYQCQNCGTLPVGFLVRAKGLSLSLEGRSPIEAVEVPSFIPKPETWLYREVVLAEQSGRPLAAIFYLRTFMEQFARRVSGSEGRIRGEELMAAYAATIPEQHRGSMPSLAEWYERLSDAIHAARPDDDLLAKARAEVEQHFDIRRVHRIPETPPPKADE